MDLFTRKMAADISKSINKGVIVDNRPYRQDTGLFPQGTETWIFAPKHHGNVITECFIQEGQYDAVAKEAKEWARSHNLRTVYLIDAELSEETKKKLNEAKENLDEKVFDSDRYSYRQHQGKPHHLEFRNHLVTLNHGDVYGTRPATSKPGTHRIIVPHMGKTRVMSVDDAEHNHMITKSLPAKKPKSLNESDITDWE